MDSFTTQPRSDGATGGGSAQAASSSAQGGNSGSASGHAHGSAASSAFPVPAASQDRENPLLSALRNVVNKGSAGSSYEALKN